MKSGAVICFFFVMLFLVSVFSRSIYCGAANSHSSSGAFGAQSTPDPVDEWSMSQHDPNRTGYSTSPGPSTNHLLWSLQLDGQLQSSPAVAGGTVYVGLYGGLDNDHNFYALNASTGAFIWNYTIGSPGVDLSSPAVVGGVVYVGSLDHNVYALNATTGALIWNYTTGAPVLSSPAVVGGVVYIGSSDHNVYALNGSTGASIWNYTTGSLVGGATAVVDGVVYVGSEDGKVYALNATTGLLLWTYQTGDTVSGVDDSPTVAGGIVYVGSNDHNFYALNASTGASIWNYTTSYGTYDTAAIVSGIVYVGSNDCNVYALNGSTGASIWNFTTGGPVITSPAVAGGTVYVGSEDSNVYALNGSTGASIWSYTTGNWIFFAGCAVAYGTVYVGNYVNGYSGNLYAIGPSGLGLAPTTTVTLLSPAGPITLGQTVTDKVTISTSATGTLPSASGTWTVYAADNSGMSDEVLVGTGSISGALPFVVTSPPFTPTHAGTWYFQASYSGDTNYTASQSTPTNEQLVVGPASVPVQITFDQIGMSNDFGGTVLTVDGTVYTYAALPVSFSWYSGSSHSFAFQSPLAVGVNSKQYVWTGTTGLSTLQSGTFIVSSSGNITGNYKTQYYLTVKTDPVGITAISGQGWYDSTSSAILTAPAVQHYMFGYWDVDGSSQGNGMNPITTTMNAPHVATAHYVLTSVPVGGYSIPFEKHTLIEPLTINFALVIGLVLFLVTFKRKTARKETD
jgi:outer membrane protein assembly factor BamB